MIINNLEELDAYGVLRYGDMVNFHIEDDELKHKVDMSDKYPYLYYFGYESNNCIFKHLRLDGTKVCTEEYGYVPPLDGIFPYARQDDFGALTRVVRRIYKEMGDTYDDETEIDRFSLIDLD